MGRDVRNPIILVDYKDRNKAKPLEPIVNENGDLIIKEKDGVSNTSIYEAFRQKLFRDGYLYTVDKEQKIDRKIFGISIDMNEPDPYAAVEYIEDAAGFTPLTFVNGNIDYGNWGEFIRPIFGMKPCIRTSEEVIHYLNPNDYESVEDDEDIILDLSEIDENGNVMIEFNKIYYKIEQIGDTLIFLVANYRVDSSYTCDAFYADDGTGDESDFIYVSAYKNSKVDGIIRSLSGKDDFIMYENIEHCREDIQSLGSKYSQLSYTKDIYLLFLSWLLFKTKNISDIFDVSNTTTRSGDLNKKGLFYAGPEGNKIFGIEDLFTNLTFLEGIMHSNDTLYYKPYAPYSEDKRKYIRIPNIVLLNNGYISKMVVVDRIVLPSELSATSNNYFGIANEIVKADNIKFGFACNKLVLKGDIIAYPRFTYC